MGNTIMKAEKKHILIIDDSPNDIQFLMQYLASDYTVLVGTSGEKGLNIALQQKKPDVILMDVMMPQMDGYETCRRLKQHPDTRDIDVIFISAHDTVEEKFAGYDAGGSDYLIKPVKPDDLRMKINLAIQNQQQRLEMNQAKNAAYSTAMTAMSNAGEMGVILDFLRKGFSIASLEELAQQIVATISVFGLQGTVAINNNANYIFAGSVEPVPPLDKELLRQVQQINRIVSAGKRAIFNYGEVSLLVKDMPEDEDKRGRYRDHLATLMEGAQAKFSELSLNEELFRFLDEANRLLKDIQRASQNHKQKSLSIADQLPQDIEAFFLPLGFSENQEKMLLELISKNVNQAIDHFENGAQIDQRFRGILARLQEKVEDTQQKRRAAG